MNVKKYGQWILLLALLLVSVKAITFTRDLVLANYYLQWNKEKATTYIYHILSAKPFLYLGLPDYQKTQVSNLIVKKAIYARYHDNKNIFTILARGSKELTLDHFKTLYPDNLYLQHLFPPTPSQSNWKNLDAVSLELLADKGLNPLTLTLWEKIKHTVDLEFAANLADYCRWQGNAELGERFRKDFNIVEPLLKTGSPTGKKSLQQLEKFIKKKKKLSLDDLKEIRPGCEDFNNIEAFKKKWDFSYITGIKDLRTASFTMGLDGVDENRCLRLMGFFAGGAGSAGADGKAVFKPRGGAMCKETLAISRGYYLLSFDYLTVTDREKASFFLWKGIWEGFLPPTNGAWKKVVYFLNNSTGNFSALKPILRMWGTGTVLIDNVYFAAVTKPTFSTNRTGMLYIVGWE